MKLSIHTTVEHYGVPRFIVKYLNELGFIDSGNTDVVLNLDTIPDIKKGRLCTVYIEADNFLKKGCFPDRYEQSDLLYIPEKPYLSYYPKKTQYLHLGIDPTFHYPREVEKKYTYVFVGRYRDNKVYHNRQRILEDLQKREQSILVTEGTQENYCDLLSSGRIILNILPRDGEDVCVNMRMCEAMMIGTLMNDYHPILDEYGFKPNVHYIPIERFGEEFTDEELERIHRNGQEFAFEHFNIHDTVHTLIRDIEAFTGEKLC